MKKIFLSIFIGGVAVLLLIIFMFGRAIFKQPTPSKPVVKPAQTKVTIIEGWDNDDIAANLDSNNKRPDAPHLATPQAFLAAQKSFSAADYPLLASKPASANLEGFLFPDTYFLPLPSTSTDESTILIKKALDNFSLKFTPSMVSAAQNRGLSVFQIVTMASIVEKETGKNVTTDSQRQALDTERGIVAGIFYNRLNIGMPLQSDATVNFITKKTTPSVSGADTKIDSPYNTYLYKGLPPRPICDPSLSSLTAALYPTTTDYFYFLTDPATGKAVFAKTFDEQLANQAKYLK